jgi:hypothetical protein
LSHKVKQRTHVAGNRKNCPDETDWALVRRYAKTYAWDEERLALALCKFGQLSVTGQEDLIRHLAAAQSHYTYATWPKEERHTLSQQRDRLRDVKKKAEDLLRELGRHPDQERKRDHARTVRHREEPRLTNVEFWLIANGIGRAGKDLATINDELGAAGERLGRNIDALKDIHDSADIALRALSSRISTNRGGDRHRLSAKGQLIDTVVAIYSHMREQHPDSGKPPALGGPMQRFICSVGELVGVVIDKSDPSIKHAWEKRKNQSLKKS